jgi:hypothetical protein
VKFGWGHDRNLVVRGTRETWATFSPDGAYRYALGRSWEPDPLEDEVDATRPKMVWVMLNPSTADETTNDPTLTKCIGFAKRHQCGGLVIVNLFALRATDPRELARAISERRDIIGPENYDAIGWAVRLFSIAVGGWGRFPSGRVQRTAIHPMAEAKFRPLHAFGTTRGGEPRHPLMLAYDTPLRAPGKWRED